MAHDDFGGYIERGAVALETLFTDEDDFRHLDYEQRMKHYREYAETVLEASGAIDVIRALQAEPHPHP